MLTQVLLLDEITVDLDVLARADLLEFLREECEERRATVVYVRLLPAPLYGMYDDGPMSILVLKMYGSLSFFCTRQSVRGSCACAGDAHL